MEYSELLLIYICGIATGITVVVLLHYMYAQNFFNNKKAEEISEESTIKLRNSAIN